MTINRQLHLAALALIAIACIGIEHGNQSTIAMMAGQRTAAACPENESAPYTPECFALIAKSFESDIRSPAILAKSLSTAPPEPSRGRAGVSGSPCPGNNENVPYTSSCIKFLSGWFWQPNSTE